MYSKKRKSQKTGRSTGDKSVDRIVNDIYNEINKLNDSVKSSYKSNIDTRDGNPGDIRIVQDKSFDSDPRVDKREFFIEAKTEEGWVRQVMDKTEHSGISRQGTVPLSSLKIDAKKAIKQGELSFWKADIKPKFSLKNAFSQGTEVYINENVKIGKNATKNLEVTGTLKLATPADGDASAENILVHDTSDGLVKKRSYAQILSDLGISASEILDWTVDQGSDNIHASNMAAAQTDITSILNSSLIIGRDSGNQIDFGTDNVIIFKADDETELRLNATTLRPHVNNGLALGNTSYQFSDLHLASGGVINWDNGNTTLTHAAGKLTLNNILEFGSLSDGTITITDFVDEDNMASNSAVKIPTQQSVKAYVDSEITGLVDSAPGALDTLNELAAALNDDASFSTTVTNSIATKVSLTGDETVAGHKKFSDDVLIAGAAADPGTTDHVSLGVSGGALRTYTDHGYITIGPQNTNWAHFYTDRANFYFNKPIVIDDGVLASYDEDLILRRDYNDTTYNQITIGDDTLDIKLDNTSRLAIDANGQVDLSGDLVLRGERGIFIENLGSPTGTSTSYGGSIIQPATAMYRTATNAHTGFIKIVVPSGTGANPRDMLTFWVDVFDYASGDSFSAYISGYNYEDAGSNEWHNCDAIILGTESHRDFTVRFCHDGSNPCITIGETDTAWNYLQVTVRNVQVGFTSDIDDFKGDWAITVETSLPTYVDETVSGNFPIASRTIGTADIATTVTLTDESSDSTCFPVFSTANTGDRNLHTDSSALTYNASNGTLASTTVSGTYLKATGSITIHSSTDAMLNFKAADDSWAYMQFLENDGTRRAYVGIDADLDRLIINATENGANEVEINTTTVDINANVDISGIITNAEWNGDVIASAYLDSDTAHLTGSQTFSGTKTFSAGTIFDGNITLNADNKIQSDTTPANNFIEFDDDSGSPENQTLISSVTNVALIVDGNNNGTGQFEILKGGTDSTATELFRIENDGDAVFTGDLFLSGEKKIQFDSADTTIYTNSDDPEDLYIEADEDMYLRPDDNLVIACGTTNYVTFDGTNQRVGIGTSTPDAELHLHSASGAGNLWITGPGSNPSSAGNLRFAEQEDGNNYFQFSHDGSANTLSVDSNNQDDMTVWDRSNNRVTHAASTRFYRAWPQVRFSDDSGTDYVDAGLTTNTFLLKTSDYDINYQWQNNNADILMSIDSQEKTVTIGEGMQSTYALKIGDNGRMNMPVRGFEFENAHGYFSPTGDMFLPLFISGTQTDLIRFQTPITFEYYDYSTSAYVDDMSNVNNLKNLLDGRRATSHSLTNTKRKFRFVITRASSWAHEQTFYIENTWSSIGTWSTSATGGGSLTPTCTIERLDGTFDESDDSNNDWTTNSGITTDWHTTGIWTDFGLAMYHSTSLHNTETHIRITITFPEFDSSKTIGLKNIGLLSSYSSVDTNQLAFKQDFDRNATGYGHLNIPSGHEYKINASSVLSATTLGSGVVNSSLTSVGTLGSLTVSGDATFDTSTLKVDSSNNRVGIGTASPNSLVHIESSDHTQLQVKTTDGTKVAYVGLNNTDMNYHLRCDGGNGDKFIIRDNTNSANRLTIDTSGNVGIGTISPAQKLDVAGSIQTNANLFFNGAGGHYIKHNGGTASSDNFTFRFSDNEDVLIVRGDGRVGINDTTPSEALDVTGNVKATGFVIGGHTIDDIDIGSEFVDTDDHIMSSGAIKEKIESYGYTTNTGTVTSVSVSDGASSTAITTSGTFTFLSSAGLDHAESGGTVTYSLDLPELTDGTADINGALDEIIYLDQAGDGTKTQKRKQVNEWKLSQFNNDGFTSMDLTGAELTTSNTTDSLLSMTQTLNAGSGENNGFAAENYAMIHGTITNTDSAGWDNAYSIRMVTGGANKFTVNVLGDVVGNSFKGTTIWVEYPFIVTNGVAGRPYYRDVDDLYGDFRKWDDYDTSPTSISRGDVAGHYVVPEDCTIKSFKAVVSNASSGGDIIIAIYHGTPTLNSSSGTTLALAGSENTVSVTTMSYNYALSVDDIDVDLDAGDIIVPMVEHNEGSNQTFRGNITLKLVTR